MVDSAVGQSFTETFEHGTVGGGGTFGGAASFTATFLYATERFLLRFSRTALGLSLSLRCFFLFVFCVRVHRLPLRKLGLHTGEAGRW